MKLAVTGGAGFIGANFVNYWMKSHPDDHCVVIDKLTYAGDLNRLWEVKKNRRFKFVKADICNFDLMKKVLKGADCVVHFAAESHVDRSLSGLEAEKLFNRTNIDGTITMLHAAFQSKVSRFHHVSTDEVFGDLDYGSTGKFHEAFPYGPHNPYAISKAAADFAVRGFARSHGLPITISNCTNNYGPYQTPEKVIPRSIALLLQNQKIQLYTDSRGIPGPNIRDWLHVDDHCSGVEKILLNGKIGETYCVGGNSELSNYQLVQKMLAIMSEITGKNFAFDSHVAFVQDRPGHDRRYAMDTAKIEQELGWKPQHTFETGFRSTVKWYVSDEGQKWLGSLAKATKEVRKGQGKRTKGRKS
jgi:dTDP-glucose 4,6-dehydratase